MPLDMVDHFGRVSTHDAQGMLPQERLAHRFPRAGIPTLATRRPRAIIPTLALADSFTLALTSETGWNNLTTSAKCRECHFLRLKM